MNEEWRPIVGYAGLYEVSDLGRVRSLRFKSQKILTRLHDDDGYWRIGLWNGERQINYKVHRLVALAFMPEKQNALHREVAHLDGDRENARLDNLKWVSKIENMSHKRLHGTSQAGEAHPQARLTEDQVKEILTLLGKKGWSYRQIGKCYGVSPWAIQSIRFGKNWKHVPRPPELLKQLSKGLGQEGERNQRAKLSARDAYEIRRRRRNGEHAMALAHEFGISKPTIYRVLSGESYRA